MARQRFLTSEQKNLIAENVTSKSPPSSRETVGLIIKEMQALRSLPAWVVDAWGDVEDIYNIIKKTSPSVSASHGWRSASGFGFQKFIQDYLNIHLNSVGIGAASKGFIEKVATNLIPLVSLTLNRQCVQSSFKVWQDTDIALVTKNGQGNWKLIAIISCKTSFHARETEACFYALARQARNLKQSLVTVDADLALGTCAKPNKVRALLEAYFDRVFSTNPLTKTCAQIRHIKEDGRTIFIDEILSWRKNVVPNYISTPLTKGSMY